MSDLQYKSNYSSLIGSSDAVNVALPALFAPVIQNNNSGWTSGFTLHNATLATATLSANYLRVTGSSCRFDSYAGVGPYELVVQYPAPPGGCSGNPVLSAKFTTNSGAMNAQVNQIIAAQNEASGYRGIAMPDTKAIVPYVRKNTTWGTGLQVQNTSASSASVTVNYYHSNGSFAGSQTSAIPGNGYLTIYPVSPSAPFVGSVVVTSTNGKSLAVIVNHLKLASGGDVLMTHIAPNR